MTMIL